MKTHGNTTGNLHGADCASTDYDDSPPEPMSLDAARAEMKRRVDSGDLQDLAGELFGDETPYPRITNVGGHDFLIHGDGRVETA